MPEEIKTLNETPTVPETPTPGTEANTPTSVPATTVPTPKADQKGLNWLHILLGVLVGALLLGGGYGAYIYYMRSYAPVDTQVASTPATSSATPATSAAKPADPTKDGKTYTNSEYKFSVKHPVDWVLNESTIPDVGKGLITLSNGNSQINFYTISDLGLQETPTVKNESIMIDKYNVNFVYEEVNNKSKLQALGSLYDSKTQKFLKEDSIYHITFVTNNNDAGQQDVNTIKQILSTFKFTN